MATVRALALVVVLSCALAGCGGGGGSKSADTTGPPTPAQERAATAGPPADTSRAAPSAVRTIRGWVNAERLSRLDVAASYFSLPAIVLNGPQPLLLRTRTAVREWNNALPCGAALLRAVDVRGWTIARFRLTDRSGGHCDSHGGSASTAFALRRGKIALWIRVRDDVSPQKAAPPRPPDRAFLVNGTVAGRSPSSSPNPTDQPAA